MVQVTTSDERAVTAEATASLYEPLDFVLVRAPLLPVQAYLNLGDGTGTLDHMLDPQVRRAVVSASPSLAAAVARFERSSLSPRDVDRMRAKLLRYQIRMSTRPTPFGLFAGVALAEWGPTTDLSIRTTCARIRTRPDMAWLLGIVQQAEADPGIRQHLRFVANPLAMVEGDRIALAERAPAGPPGPPGPVSIRATGVVMRALTLARQPVACSTLVERLCEATPSATPEKVQKLLTDLWDQTFLLTDLRPPLTAPDPARRVADRLRPIAEAAALSSRLDGLLEEASTWDRLPPGEAADGFERVLTRAGAQPDGSGDLPVQVDMAMAVEGRVGHAVAREAARAAELLLRLSPAPRGQSSIASYRQAFLNRYGHDRDVALLELVDPLRGLGPPPAHGHAAVGPDSARAADRHQTLLHLACTALHDRARTVALDEALLERLETWRPEQASAPLSVDVNVLVAARSTAAIDAGDFSVVVGPNLGAPVAGRNLGRFADLLAPDGPDALRRTAAAVREHVPEDLWVELVYLPSNLRSANVVIRPAIHSHEVALGASAGVPDGDVVPLDELVVGVEGGRFRVRWPAAGRRVIFTAGHMLNNVNAPPIARFLVDAGQDARAIFSVFDWGPAEMFPYLPRVTCGRVVLRPAQWRPRKEDPLDRWRAEWNAPRHVCLTVGDNRLVVDLDSEQQAAEVRSELRKLPEGGSLIVQEVVPALDEAWLPGPGGRHYSELVVPLVLRAARPVAGEHAASVAELSSPTPQTDGERNAASPSDLPVDASANPPVQRYHPPGSEWLFVKLYCARRLEEDLIGQSMLTFCDNVVAAGLADSWFFIRYSDPDAHLRLRFHGLPERLTSRLFGQLCEWANGLLASGMCAKFTFEPYEQEIERFGGIAGMAAAEAVFAADSRAAASLLRSTRGHAWPHDRTTLLALTIDDLLAGLGFDERQRLRWYRAQTNAKDAAVSNEYRQRKNVLRSLLGNPAEGLESQEGVGSALADILAERRTAVSIAARDLRTLLEHSALSQTLETMAASFVHLHVNRLAGLDWAPEHRVLGLLLRTRESLEKAPPESKAPAR